MRITFLLPLVLLGLAACVSVEKSPQPATATVVQPTPTVVTPAPTTSTTIVRTP